MGREFKGCFVLVVWDWWDCVMRVCIWDWVSEGAPCFTFVDFYTLDDLKEGQLLHGSNWQFLTLHMPGLPQKFLWERKENGHTTKTFTMCSDFFVKWIMTTTSSFTPQCKHTMRSCKYLSLLSYWPRVSMLVTHSHTNVLKCQYMTLGVSTLPWQ